MENQSVWDRIDAERLLRAKNEARRITKREWAQTIGIVPEKPSANPGATYNNWKSRGVPTDAYEGILKATKWSYEYLTTGVDKPKAQTSSVDECKDPWSELHTVLKALHIVVDDELEVVDIIRKKHERAVALMKHLNDNRNA